MKKAEIIFSILIFIALSSIIFIPRASENPQSDTTQTPTGNLVRFPILVYHSITDYPLSEFKIFTSITVTPEVFKEQMQYLKDSGYTVVPLNLLVDNLTKGTALPPNPIAITFDDGWESQYNFALPILKSYGYTATFFIYTNPIGTRSFMTWDEIKNLDGVGMTIGGHSKSHPFLPKILDDEALAIEISSSKKIIEDHIGKPVTLFAYPFGRYNDHVSKVVQDSGYSSARTIDTGVIQSNDNLFKLKGIMVTNSFETFKRMLR